jgi:hypothetical protein
MPKGTTSQILPSGVPRHAAKISYPIASVSELAQSQIGTVSAWHRDVNPDHVDFISSYCDRWCERCAFTHRCSAFTAMAAIAMCEDDRAGLELAFGRAPDDSGAVAPPPRWLEDLVDEPISPDEEAELIREHDGRHRRVEETATMQTAKAFMHLAYKWLNEWHDELGKRDDVVREAFAVATHDFMFICVKLHRALDGRDRQGMVEEGDDDPVQNDWNGSAKIALIAIERSAEAWSVLASATSQQIPAALAAQLTDLRADVERTFPDARRFRRPGFDE